jgi:hypothetical protein
MPGEKSFKPRIQWCLCLSSSRVSIAANTLRRLVCSGGILVQNGTVFCMR